MAIISAENKVHWNYFLALEKDLELATRYVEFADANMATYSIEFAHLLFAAASEVDVVAKLLCKQLNLNIPTETIEHYRTALIAHIPDLPATQVLVPRYALTFTPWDSWNNNQTPSWWHSYNKVKHERNAHFQKATLENALNALAALMTLVFYHYSYPDLQSGHAVDKKETTRYLLPTSSLLRFTENYYYDNLIV
ncbi:hypothetical protein MNZ22_10410 [Aeromonas encheleia]|uniref:hypothetical protein n=1 Tax=Aeromonas encheleia TaxID=73010 RepID=UPI001F5AA1BB|nr:hypothetical protein [Aeromonas encheleia]UNP90542.1 hypothetical protein MNZ22_10410 [Aeromonas encheleia]